MQHECWSLVLLAGLWGWIISTLVLIFRSFTEHGAFSPRPALKWGVCVVLFFSIWVMGLLNA